MQEAQIYISTIMDSGSGFAARTDDGSQAFLPSSVVRASGIAEGDIVAGKLIPNTHPNSGNTPWVAVYVAKPANDDPDTSDIDGRAYEAVEELFLATTAEVAREVEADEPTARAAMLRLFKAGRVAKADVYASSDQSRPLYTIWARGADDFLGAME